MNIEDALKIFLNNNKCAELTKKLNEYNIRLMIERIPHKDINKITHEDIKNSINKLIQEGYKDVTIYRQNFSLRSFFEFCLEENLISKNPMYRVPYIKKPTAEIPRCLTPIEMNLLREASKECLRNRCIIETLYATGVRMSELLNLRLENVNLEERVVFIKEGKGLKSRLVPISSICAELLKNYLQTRNLDNEYLFLSNQNRRLSNTQLAKIIKKYAGKAGLNKVTPHTFRHTFAVTLINKDVDLDIVQKLLGHKSKKDTIWYARIAVEFRKQQYDYFNN